MSLIRFVTQQHFLSLHPIGHVALQEKKAKRNQAGCHASPLTVFFSVDRDRFGCPDFDNMEHERDDYKVDRTVTLSVFPHDVIQLTASERHDQISPNLDPEDSTGQMSNLFRLATQCAEKDDYYKLYEDGWEDAERWLKEEEERDGYWGSMSSNERRQIYAEALKQKDLN